MISLDVDGPYGVGSLYGEYIICSGTGHPFEDRGHPFDPKCRIVDY